MVEWNQFQAEHSGMFVIGGRVCGSWAIHWEGKPLQTKFYDVIVYKELLYKRKKCKMSIILDVIF